MYIYIYIRIYTYIESFVSLQKHVVRFDQIFKYQVCLMTKAVARR